MLKIVEFGLLAVSLLTVLALIVAAPRAAKSVPADTAEPEIQPKAQP